jgi:hypothetical protein
MWYPIFYVYGGLSRKGPEEIFKIGVNEHRASHTGDSEIGLFGDTILGWGVRDGFFVRDPCSFAVRFHFLTHSIRVRCSPAENGNSFVGKVLSCCAVLNEACQRVITGFQEEKRNVTTEAVDEENVV